MSILELKIPPLLVAVIFAFLMWLTALWTNELGLLKYYKWAFFVTFFCMGLFFSVSGVVSFKKANTTVNPTTPGASSSLVTTGIYRYSRNPMYVGFLFMLIAWGFLLSNVYAISLTFGFLLYLNQFQIKPEEKMLNDIFGPEFYDYEKRVRRWL